MSEPAVGRSPLEAILCEDGEGQAKFFGWPASYPAMTDELKKRRQEAESLTDQLCAPAYEVLSGMERAEFVDLVAALTSIDTK